MEIDRLTEFEGSIAVAYQCNGHVDKAAFLAALRKDYAGERLIDSAVLDDVEHCYGRFIPVRQLGIGWQQIEYRPKRGAKPITHVDLTDVEVRLTKARLLMEMREEAQN